MSAVLLSLLIWQLVRVPGAWAQDIRDVKPPVDLPANWTLLYLGLAIAAVLTGILLVEHISNWIRRTRKSKTPALSPWTVALQKLDQLKSLNLPAQGKIKEYYTLLSDIIRRYLEDRFSIRAPEMTTPEFLWQMKDSRELTAEQKSTLTDFLNSCDLVKFAKYGPSLKEMDDSFLSARKLIEETILLRNGNGTDSFAAIFFALMFSR